jgi:hypothetical protein
MNYYDQNDSPIYIPSSNQDAFIRRGYYRGHADTYKPYGENIYYYDVNSLYPRFVVSTLEWKESVVVPSPAIEQGGC